MDDKELFRKRILSAIATSLYIILAALGLFSCTWLI